MTCVYCHEKEPVKEGLCIECFDYLKMQLEEDVEYSAEVEDFYYFSEEPVDTFNIDGELDIPF